MGNKSSGTHKSPISDSDSNNISNSNGDKNAKSPSKSLFSSPIKAIKNSRRGSKSSAADKSSSHQLPQLGSILDSSSGSSNGGVSLTSKEVKLHIGQGHGTSPKAANNQDDHQTLHSTALPLFSSSSSAQTTPTRTNVTNKQQQAVETGSGASSSSSRRPSLSTALASARSVVAAAAETNSNHNMLSSSSSVYMSTLSSSNASPRDRESFITLGSLSIRSSDSHRLSPGSLLTAIHGSNNNNINNNNNNNNNRLSSQPSPLTTRDSYGIQSSGSNSPKQQYITTDINTSTPTILPPLNRKYSQFAAVGSPRAAALRNINSFQSHTPTNNTNANISNSYDSSMMITAGASENTNTTSNLRLQICVDDNNNMISTTNATVNNTTTTTTTTTNTINKSSNLHINSSDITNSSTFNAPQQQQQQVFTILSAKDSNDDVVIDSKKQYAPHRNRISFQLPAATDTSTTNDNDDNNNNKVNNRSNIYDTGNGFQLFNPDDNHNSNDDDTTSGSCGFPSPRPVPTTPCLSEKLGLSLSLKSFTSSNNNSSHNNYDDSNGTSSYFNSQYTSTRSSFQGAILSIEVTTDKNYEPVDVNNIHNQQHMGDDLTAYISNNPNFGLSFSQLCLSLDNNTPQNNNEMILPLPLSSSSQQPQPSSSSSLSRHSSNVNKRTIVKNMVPDVDELVDIIMTAASHNNSSKKKLNHSSGNGSMNNSSKSYLTNAALDRSSSNGSNSIDYSNKIIDKEKAVVATGIALSESNSTYFQHEIVGSVLSIPDMENQVLPPTKNSNCYSNNSTHDYSPSPTQTVDETTTTTNSNSSNTRSDVAVVVDEEESVVVTMDDFIEIRTLGNGASSTVAEALHIPTFTLVALKKLPLYNPEKRQQVANELKILQKNCVEFSTNTTTSKANEQSISPAIDSSSSNSNSTGSSHHILGFYNAFIDYSNGLVNLVVEYMDSGSLEDLVQDGGCPNESVLADIAHQTLLGLVFLHDTAATIHRDIKPANILCTLTHSHTIDSDGIININRVEADSHQQVHRPRSPSHSLSNKLSPSSSSLPPVVRARSETTDSVQSLASLLQLKQQSLSVSVKIADFGISEEVDENSPSRTFIGTIPYMSPERITGESSYSFPSDIWSFGLTLLTIASGSFPYSNSNRNKNSRSRRSTLSKSQYSNNNTTSRKSKNSTSQHQSANNQHNQSSRKSKETIHSQSSATESASVVSLADSTTASAGGDTHLLLNNSFDEEDEDDQTEHDKYFKDHFYDDDDDDYDSNEDFEEGHGSNSDVNGGGFWTMVKVICDDPSPTPDENIFSKSFCDFIEKCLDKNPDTRYTASQLLNHPFIKDHINSSSYIVSDSLDCSKDRLVSTVASDADVLNCLNESTHTSPPHISTVTLVGIDSSSSAMTPSFTLQPPSTTATHTTTTAAVNQHSNLNNHGIPWTPLAARLNQALLKKDLLRSQTNAYLASIMYDNLPILNQQLVFSLTNHTQHTSSLSSPSMSPSYKCTTSNSGSIINTFTPPTIEQRDQFRSFAKEIKRIKENHFELIVTKLVQSFIQDKKDFLENIDSAREREIQQQQQQLQNRKQSTILRQSPASLLQVSSYGEGSGEGGDRTISMSGRRGSKEFISMPLKRMVSKYSGRISQLEAEANRLKELPAVKRKDEAKEFLLRKKYQLLPDINESESENDDSLSQQLGLLKWKNLSNQLNLPFSLVKKVVESLLKEHEKELSSI